MVVSNSVRTLRFTHILAPRIVERAVARIIERGFLRQEPEEPSPGNLYEPSSEWVTADGGYNREAGRRAALTARRAATAGVSVLGSGILTWIFLRKARALRSR